MILAFDFQHDVAALATLIVAITGFVAMLRRQGRTEAKVTKVEEQVNGAGEEVVPGKVPTLGQEVRQMRDDVAAIKRELGIRE